MLTITPYSIGYCQQNVKIVKNYNQSNTQSLPIQNSNVSFQANKSREIVNQLMINKTNACNKTSRPAIRDSVLEEFNNVFLKYKQDLHETSISDIKSTVVELENKYPRKKILSTMQKATQFANISSIKTIIKTLNKENVGSICDITKIEQPEFVKNNFGLNITLHYLINKKRMGNLSGRNNAIFLDKNKLVQLKEESAINPSYVKDLVNEPKNKFFVLSGFDNGINFLNRNNDLREKTLDLIEQDNIDTDIVKQANELGINPIVIKNVNEPTLENVYKQMRPEQMTKEELNSVIDAGIIFTYKNIDVQSSVKKDTIKYLHNNLLVITPEVMSKGFSNIHKNILEYNQSIGKNEKDLLFCIPDSEKSYGLINHQYQLTNGIDRNKFIDMDTILYKIDSPKLKNKTIVFLDDCAMSGNSMSDNFFPFSERLDAVKKQKIDFIYAPLVITPNGKNKIQEFILKNKRKNDKVFFYKQVNNDWQKDIEKPNLLNHMLGNTAFGYQWQCEEKPCVIFPYMAPDNNCNFAANIALLHDINHNQCNTNAYFLRIKSGCLNTYMISDLSKKLLDETKNS